MQKELFIQQEDFSGEKVLLGLSGGINSAAVACWLAQWPEEYKPEELHIFYAHFKEHSPDTARFVMDIIRFCKKNFKTVKVKITRNSVIDFFEKEKMIPHPTVAPCTRKLKIIPMHEYMFANEIKTDLVGYVRDEIVRVRNMAEKSKNDIDGRSIQMNDVKKLFPISDKTNEWCFVIVKGMIGWYPKIYDFRYSDKAFKIFVVENLYRMDPDTQKQLKKKINSRARIFLHNNCLPCKNMQAGDFLAVEFFYEWYYQQSKELSLRLKKHWGRVYKEKNIDQKLDELLFHLDFGRTPEETGFTEQTCGVCAFG